jgi:hypothetical protein
VTRRASLRPAVVVAGVAVLGTAVALALSHHRHHAASLPPPVGPWYSALAAPYTPSRPRKSACGVVIGRRTAGVTHPVLPCGTKLYIALDGKEVLTQVIDRGRARGGRTFAVTQALAKLLGMQGTQAIRWRFAS